MCGIAGAVFRLEDDPGIVVAMTRRLAHRGPDDEQFHFGSRVGFGIRRLSIIDPAEGRQPVASEDERVVAMCNGEIYNHLGLRSELAALGHRFRSGTDAEVLPHLYEEMGSALVSRLHGKFALALVDPAGGRLLLARDRLGIKPLYFTETEHGFWFASELKSLLLVPGFVPAVDRAALDLMLAFKHIPGDATLLRGVRCLPPGHTLVYDLNAHRYDARPYWEIPHRPHAPPLHEAAGQVRRLFDAAVRDRLMSDVPLGVALSGGLDSSAVVASVALQADAPPRTFSVHVGDQVNELGYARLVAERFGTDHHEEVVQLEDLDRLVPHVMWHLEEPMAVSEIPTWYLGQAAGRHVKVLLCGEGADELFGGYKRFLPLAAAPWLPTGWLKWGYLRGLNGLTLGDRRALYAPDHQLGMTANTNPWLDRALDASGEPMLNRLLRYELSHQLRSQLTRLDKLTMAHGVEARCPFLDAGLVAFVANLPPEMKVRGLREKVLLKAAMADRLPPAILARRKHGMRNPVGSLFTGPFRDLCRQRFQERAEVLDRYVTRSGLDRLFRGVGRSPAWWRIPEQQLFHLYLFLHWHDAFIDGRVPDGV